MKRIITYLLVFTMIFSCLPVSVFATGGTTRGGGAGRRIAEMVSGFDMYGGSYLEHLVSSDEATEVDPYTFMGLGIDSIGYDIVSRYQGQDSDYLGVGYYISVPSGVTSSLPSSYIARELIIEDSGVWHFFNFLGSSAAAYDCISLYLDGTIGTFVFWYSAFDAYEITVIDYASSAAYYEIINLLSGIAENMGVIEGGSGGGSVEVDTSEMEESLSSIDSSLAQVLTYLSSLNQNVIDTEKYSKEISEALGGVEVKVANIDADLDGIQDTLDELSLILLNIGADNAEIKGYVDDIEFYISVIGDRITYLQDYLMQINANIISTNSILSNIKDKIDYVHLSLIDKLNELISAVKDIGIVSGDDSSGDDGSFIGDLLGGIFGVAFESLKLILELVFNLLSSLLGWILRLSSYAASFFGGVIPADVFAIITVIPMLSLVLGVVKFLRG